MLHTGRKLVTTAGTRVALASTRTTASWVTVQAFSGNAKAVYLGDVTVAYDSAGTNKSYTGHQLLPGDFANLREMGGPTIYDLSAIYIDADSNGDGVCFNYGRR